MCVKSSSLQLPPSSGRATETACYRACPRPTYSTPLPCSLGHCTPIKHSLSLLCSCKPGAARHACLPGSTYSSDGHRTVLDILLWAVVQPLPMSIFSLDWNKTHPTGKVIVSLRKKPQPFFVLLWDTGYGDISCCSMCFLKTYGDNFSHCNFHL